MANIVVEIAAIRVSKNPEDILVTYALGSCLGIALYDPGKRVAGLGHFMLPDSRIENGSVNYNPLKYVNSGVPLLFKEMYRAGAERQNIRNAIIGGAKIMDDNEFFNIGRKNITALRKLFWRNNVLIQKQHVGGSINRTVRLNVATGTVSVKLSTGETIQL